MEPTTCEYGEVSIRMDGFGKFLELVHAEAARLGRIFALESIEGNERPDCGDGLEVQELSGFLLTEEQARQHAHGTIGEVIGLHHVKGLDFVFVNWEMSGDTLKIAFEPA